MATGVIIASILISAAASVYAILMARKNKPNNMPPPSDYNPTMAAEGSAIALLYGRVRVAGNLIWWGNLESRKEKVKSGGKGFGKKQKITVVRYYVDAWQVIGMGKLELVEVYVNDKKGEDVNAAQIIYNDGTEDTFHPGATYANRLRGVAHWCALSWALGESTQMPTLHFVVNRVLDTPISYQNLANGSNPAAVIYDLLVNQAGVPASSIDTASFNAAASFWNARGYGLNLVFDQQGSMQELIEEVFQYAPGILYIDSANRYAIRAIDPGVSYDREITEADINEFSFNRKTWTQTPNDFRATFVDQDNDFSERVVIAQNPAAIRLAGQRNTQSIDLKAFRDAQTASRRVFEIMKRESYPAAQIRFRANLRFGAVLPGEVLRVYHEDYGLAGADFRVSEVGIADLDKNEVEITAEQLVETLHDDVFQETGRTYFEPADFSLLPALYQGAFEFPYTREYGDLPVYLALVEKRKGIESDYEVIGSGEISANYYTVKDSCVTFAQRVLLEDEYPADTHDIDDETGILFSCPSGSFKIEIASVSRGNLFQMRRVAILGDELLAFQTITTVGPNLYRLMGVVRGVYGTTKATHADGSFGWISEVDDNLVEVRFANFYLKYLLRFGDDELDEVLATAVNAQYGAKAKKPRDVSRISAVRTGSSVVVQLWPSSPGVRGAGDDQVEVTDKEPPFDFMGDFQVSYDTTTAIETSDSFSVTRAGAFDLTVKSRLNGFLSAGKTVAIGAADGQYVI